VEAGDAVHTLGQSATAKPFAVLVLDVDVVVGLGPIHSDEDHPLLLDRSATNPSLEAAAAP